MSNNCEGTWAGRFVICLQLLSWCAVGALLLHRGFTSVKRDVTNLPASPNTTNDSYAQSEQIAKDMIVDNSTEDVKLPEDKFNIKQSGNAIELDSYVNKTSETSKTTPVSKKTPTHGHNVRVTSTGKMRYDLTPSGIVMAALGVVMLVVGPSVVILRCCDTGRQGRRFDKLSADERALDLAALDLPPSYDDVASRAPRYSMLFPDDEDSSVIYTDAATHHQAIVV